MKSNSFLSYTIPDDGYTRSGYIAPVLNLHGEVRFKFRPMIHETREKLNESLQNSKTVLDAQKLIVGMISGRITEWSICGKDKSGLTIDANTVRRLLPRLIERFYAIISGREGGDTDPLNTMDSEAYNGDVDAATLAEINGTTATVQAEVNDIKN